MRVNSLIFKYIILELCFVLNIFPADFNMRVFKVGQANFVLLTKEENALVIDCGVGNGYGGALDRVTGTPISSEIQAALENVTNMGIVITHNHIDHCNNIGGLKRLIDSINGDRNRKARRQGIEIPKIRVSEACRGWLGTKTDVDDYLMNYFPPDELETVRPNDFLEAFISPEERHEHENNLILVVHQYGKHILLPGDANATLFAYHSMYTDDFFETIKNINIFLASHHGSTANGEYVWLAGCFGTGEDREKFTIISSDPLKSDHIPQAWFLEKAGELSRVFLTSHSHNVCYKITITNNGQIEIH